jgi:predicted dehydrogenase
VKRIAVIGCGAIASSFHLPALGRRGNGEVEVVLVDPDLDRARALASRFGASRVAASHEDVATEIDAAIVASPHETHAPIALDLLSAGIPVLSEKPLGTSVAQIEALIDRAEERGLPLAVNQTRRFIPACSEVGRLLQDGTLGRLLSIEASEGDRFDWPAATPSMFGARSGGKGVLLDIGVHVLDLLTWWLGPELTVEHYEDDSFGGSEASATARLRAGDVPIRMRLSWLARQANQIRFVGERGALTWSIYDLDRVSLDLDDARGARVIAVRGAPRDFAGLAPAVLENFLNAVAGEGEVAVSASDVLPSMRLIEACYARRTRYAMPWHPFTSEAVDDDAAA